MIIDHDPSDAAKLVRLKSFVVRGAGECRS